MSKVESWNQNIKTTYFALLIILPFHLELLQQTNKMEPTLPAEKFHANKPASMWSKMNDGVGITYLKRKQSTIEAPN